ncbi:hypothetical protein GCM10011579_026140 [Streptomyces albiflavescens]|uniref:Uncharacterized protein n=1 Tax=Streptomyces albiflavescens TaxID=1623582 RepID=A0A917XZS4_9ACTN|nr:hypothetical protein [Streptomyces albiflavescens]GGN60736.1 hypothetical protein GCM10011579_026140 [Streptomyces albiflavescens]
MISGGGPVSRTWSGPIARSLEYVGAVAGLTPKAYAHLMPSSRDRARKALGLALRPQDPEG